MRRLAVGLAVLVVLVGCVAPSEPRPLPGESSGTPVTAAPAPPQVLRIHSSYVNGSYPPGVANNPGRMGRDFSIPERIVNFTVTLSFMAAIGDLDFHINGPTENTSRAGAPGGREGTMMNPQGGRVVVPQGVAVAGKWSAVVYCNESPGSATTGAQYSFEIRMTVREGAPSAV